MESLRAFSVFAEHLNFTRAAEVLSISQPALHTKIQELGRTLGVPLYFRQGRQLQLTSQGEQLARLGREWNDRLHDFLDEFYARDQAGPVEVAAGQGAYLYLLGPTLRQFLQSGGRLRLASADRDGVLQALRAGQAQLGVTALEHPPEDLAVRRLVQIHQRLILPSGHPLTRKRSLTLTDLSGLELVVPPAGRPHRQMLESHLARAGVAWKIGVEAGGWELMIHFVGLGLGLAVVNSFCSLPRGLVSRPLSELPTLDYYALRPRGYRRPEAERLYRLLVSSDETASNNRFPSRASSRAAAPP